MTISEVKTLKVGSKVKNILGDTLVVISCEDDNNWIGLKWLHEDGTLSKGIEYCVPSHFKHDELISL